MLEVVTDAVRRLGRDDVWSSVRDALDGLSRSEVADQQSGCTIGLVTLDDIISEVIDGHKLTQIRVSRIEAPADGAESGDHAQGH